MTEQEWWDCTTLKPMAEDLNFPHADERKRWLFACACCRRIWSLMTDARSREVIEVREQHAVGSASNDELWRAVEAAHLAREDARAPFRSTPTFDDNAPEAATAWAAAAAATNSATAVHFVLKAVGCLASRSRRDRQIEEQAALCAVLRDIFAYPFRPVTVVPSWLTSTVVTLAHGIYAQKAFDRMLILADALQDAGCENADILNHCREPGEHVRGCWVVDLLLGKG